MYASAKTLNRTAEHLQTVRKKVNREKVSFELFPENSDDWS